VFTWSWHCEGLIIIIIIIIIILISFMQGIYIYIPEKNYVPRENSVTVIIIIIIIIICKQLVTWEM